MSDARHASLPPHLSEPILTVDEDSAIVAANPAACRTLGATEEALRGAPFLARVRGEARPIASTMLVEGFRGRTGEATLPLHCQHAEAHAFRVRVVPVVRVDGAPRLLLMLRQLTDERQPGSVAPHEAATFDAVVRGVHERVRRPHGAPAAAMAETSLRVLVIDDDAALRSTIRRSLEAGGYRVQEATSGRHALTQLQDGLAVDLLVTDLKMENGSGGWLLAQLAYEHPELLDRTVVMAGDAGGAGAAHVASRWHCPMLGKPFRREELLGVLTALTRNLGRPAEG